MSILLYYGFIIWGPKENKCIANINITPETGAVELCIICPRYPDVNTMTRLSASSKKRLKRRLKQFAMNRASEVIEQGCIIFEKLNNIKYNQKANK